MRGRAPDTDPNRLQNFPVIDSASNAQVHGRLNSRPGKTFLIQLFSSPAPNFPIGFGGCETFLGEQFATTNDRGKVTFTAPFGAGEVVTATATDSVGHTSEFSQTREQQNAPLDQISGVR